MANLVATFFRALATKSSLLMGMLCTLGIRGESRMGLFRSLVALVRIVELGEEVLNKRCNCCCVKCCVRFRAENECDFFAALAEEDE